jgi:hypothetical protein
MDSFFNSVIKYVVVLSGISSVVIGVLLGVISQRRRAQAEAWEEERKKRDSLLAEQGQEAAQTDRKFELWDNFEDD